MMTSFVLVCHSYVSMVITGVTARIPERIAQLIYIDSVTPKKRGFALWDHGTMRRAIQEVLPRDGPAIY